MPQNPGQELVIAIAGPMVNVIIAGVIYLILPGRYQFDGLGRLGGTMISSVMTINVGLVLFNLIPAFPMDGGRVLRALLAFKLPHAKATRIAARIGQGIAVLFALVILTPYGSPILLLIALFVFSAAQQELAYSVAISSPHSNRTAGEVMITQFQSVSDTLPLGEVRAFLLESNQSIFPVIDGERRFYGLVIREELLKAAQEMPPETSAVRVARPVTSVEVDTPLDEALEMMNRLQEPVLPVLNPARQLVGLLVVPRE